jgi:hypothetical protein
MDIWTIFWILEIILVVWALIDLIMSDTKRYRALAQYGFWLWLLLIIILPVIGSIAYAIIEQRMFMKWL